MPITLHCTRQVLVGYWRMEPTFLMALCMGSMRMTSKYLYVESCKKQKIEARSNFPASRVPQACKLTTYHNLVFRKRCRIKSSFVMCLTDPRSRQKCHLMRPVRSWSHTIFWHHDASCREQMRYQGSTRRCSGLKDSFLIANSRFDSSWRIKRPQQ